MGDGQLPDSLLAQLHPLEVRILPHLENGTTISQLAKRSGLQEVEATRACQWLANKKAIELKPHVTRTIILGANAKKALKEGLPEMRFLQAVRKGAKTAEEAAKQAKLDTQELGVSLGILKKRKLIIFKGKNLELTKDGKSLGTLPELTFLQKIEKNQQPKDEETLDALKRRKAYIIVKERRDKKITLTDLGNALAKLDTKTLDFHDRLTKEDLETGAWKSKKYRAYDVSINVPAIPTGKLHFVQEAIDYIRRIWLEMGFQEMTGAMAHNAFWDLDALFVPQDHPAREMQDTFYLEHPSRKPVDKQVFERVRDAHERGGTTGSKGWRYTFSKDESERLLLRTHTTVLSAETLWKIKNGEKQLPGKYFTVGKVFRNERLDWKHLFEFHQVEGIVVGKDVSLAQLLGYLKVFFAKMGFTDVRMRPSHFPYTEPSCEVDVWNPRKKQWVELGGSGIFRPEVTKTLIGEEVPVLAWGLGLERIIVEYFDLTDLRDLYRNDIKQLQEMKRFIKIEDNG